MRHYLHLTRHIYAMRPSLGTALVAATLAWAAPAAYAVCGAAYTPIYVAQGSGDTTPLTGTITVQGVVVADFEGASPALRGFYLQDPLGDGNPATSDGIFVFSPSGGNLVTLGDVVRVTGTVGEFQGQTQITSTTAAGIERCGRGSVVPVDVLLPFADAQFAERYEGMLVRLPQTLTVTEHFQLGRFGQVVVSVNGRQMQPTNVVAPGAAAIALQAQNQLGRIILDDSGNAQNPDPIVFGRGGLPLSANNTLRGGDTVSGVVGVMTFGWAGNAASGNAWRVRPVVAGDPVSLPLFQASNARPTQAPTPPVAPAGSSSLRVAGFNVLNFFNNVLGCTGGVGAAATDCRGAGSDVNGAAAQQAQFAVEYPRQLAKTLAALTRLNADVVGLVEIENDGYGAGSALRALVDALNGATTPGRYALIDADTRSGQVNALGSDAIKVAFIYQPARVAPVGKTAVLNSAAFVGGGDALPRNRPALAQAWQQNDGARFVAVVNHFKSKGSACTAPDAGDGQGQCNAVRTQAAQLLRDWLASNPTGTFDPDVLVVGDLNAYAKEDPITTFTNSGWRDLVGSYNGADAYGYVFDGQWGYLDHALATPSLALGQVAGARHWHINADEPSVLDYNVNFKTAGQIAALYAADEFRNSDHDPVIVDLMLAPPKRITGTAGADVLVGTAGDDIITGGPGRDVLTGGAGRDLFVYNSVLDGGDTITDFQPGLDVIVLTQLISGLGLSANSLPAGVVSCTSLGADALIGIDRDGSAGPLPSRPLVLLKNLGCARALAPQNYQL
jgi:uncharacterized protein